MLKIYYRLIVVFILLSGLFVSFTNNEVEAAPTDVPTFISKIGTGSSGLSDDQFNEPQGVAVDSSGNVYVTDIYIISVCKSSTLAATF